MLRMKKFPPFGKRFFRRARKLIGSCHFEHFWRVVMVLASLQDGRSLSKFEEATDSRRSRQAISNFLTVADWNAPELLQQTAVDQLQRLGFRPGDAVYLVLDDTQKQKRGKLMAAVSKIFLHAEKIYANGHTILGAALVYRGVVLPCAMKLWASKDACRKSQSEPDPIDQLTFRKLTEMAADVIMDLQLPQDSRPIVLFDSYYLCSNVAQACAQRGWKYVGVAKKNRNIFPDGRPHDRRKLGKYGCNILRREGRVSKVRGKNYRLAERVGNLKRLGRAKLVFSRRPRESTWVCLVTNETRWSKSTVLSHYLRRWGIEVFFKMSKQYLGLGDYHLMRYRGIERYLCLVLIAHLLLTHLALDLPDAKAQVKKRADLRLPSVPQLQQHMRRRMWNHVLDGLAKNKTTRNAVKRIKEAIQL